MPGKYPQEFCKDAVAVARGREPGVTLSQIAKDFGISDQTLTNWLKQADISRMATSPVSRKTTRLRCGSCGAVTGCWSRRTRC